MEQTIKSYQYFSMKREVDQLLNVYSPVDDPKTVQTAQTLAAEKIRDILEHELPEIDTFLTTVLDVKLTKVQVERALKELKQTVQPFMQPSKPQIEKLFRKVKKLEQPIWNEIDLQEHMYISWNDPGTQKKFMIYYEDEKLEGISGILSSTINKGICAIYQKTSNMSLFPSTTETGSDGTYTKKGNYVCRGSNQCNRQLTKLAPFYKFAERVKKER